MLAPIRPRPMNPMRIWSVLRYGIERGRQGPFERGQPGVDVVAKVHPQDRQIVALDGREIAGGLRVDELAERVRPARDLAVVRMVRGELEEPADRGAAGATPEERGAARWHRPGPGPVR